MVKSDLTNQRQLFVEDYALCGDNLEVAKQAWYKDTHTLCNQAYRLGKEFADEITEELNSNFTEIEPKALNILNDLVWNAESQRVGFGATRDLL